MTRRRIWLVVAGLLAASSAEADEQTPHLYMPDGQLKSHSIRVYVTQTISPSQQPRLRLLRSNAVTERAVDEARVWLPGITAPGQEWVERVRDQDVRYTGTLLLFDLSGLDFRYKAMMRVMPVVTWNDAGAERIVVAEREVNVGNIVATIGWTALTVAITLGLIVFLSRRARDNPLLFLTGSDGHLSLAQTQVAFWTLVVGGVVLGYGMIRLEVPAIPPSLVVLMGASLATGGLAYFHDARKQQAAVAAGTAAMRAPQLGDLVRTFVPGLPSELSLAKAQMMFWTVVLLLLFVSKSVLDGVIWEVPWPLVALMGFSQAGYVVPKMVPGPAAEPPRANQPTDLATKP